MGLESVMTVSRAALDVERMRVEVAMRNLANAQTVAQPGQSAFVPMRVVARSDGRAHAGVGPAAAMHWQASLPFASVQPSLVTERRVLDPGHPDADAEGIVRYPAVDTATEMMEMTRAYRAYEANVAALQTTRALVLKALDIGGQS